MRHTSVPCSVFEARQETRVHSEEAGYAHVWSFRFECCFVEYCFCIRNFRWNITIYDCKSNLINLQKIEIFPSDRDNK